MKKNKGLSDNVDLLELKSLYFSSHASLRSRKRWYKKYHGNYWFRMKLHCKIKKLAGLWIPFKLLSFIRWILVDFLRGKPRKFWGIYQFVALPGEGKTLSMVAHLERVRHDFGSDHVLIATNFFYKYQSVTIGHWSDMIFAAKQAQREHKHCVLAVDEIHTTFDSSDWRNFPPEILSLLSFNRKYGLQFLCSSQIYDRIPKKIRDISNYTVLCKNTFGFDRHFKNYYYNTLNYEDKFSGKRSRASFIRTYIADDYLYSLYDTLAQVDRMTADARKEDDLRKQAFDLLFGSEGNDEKTG